MTTSGVARMSAAKSGAGVSVVPGFRCAHPGYETAEVICPTGCFWRDVSSPISKNISVLQHHKSPYIPPRPVPPKGRCATSSTRGGMRWTLTVLLTRAPDADGEVVWSWRLDAGVKSAEAIPPATETNQPDLRGEHEVSRKTIAWGMPGVTGVTCMLVCAFYSILHTRPWGASSARHSLRPYQGRGDRIRQTSRNSMRRDREGVCAPLPPRASRVAGRGRGWGVSQRIRCQRGKLLVQPE